MPLEKGQRVLPDPVPRPMTTKQARKEYLERTRGPKLTKEQQRAEERRLQAEIRRDIKKRDEEAKKAEERERTSIRAKAARDRAKAKEEAEKVAKRKAGKPLKPPRPSQASIMGFMKGNATTKKRASVEEDTKLEAIREESAPPASSSGSSTKRRRLSEADATIDCPGPEDNETDKDPSVVEARPGGGVLEPAEVEDTVPPHPLADMASPEVQHEQAADIEPPPSGQAEVEPEPHTASCSPTPVSSPRPDQNGRTMSLAISFSLDDFEDSLASALQLDEELQGPGTGNHQASDQAAEDTKPAAVDEDQGQIKPEGRVVAKPVPDLDNILPFLSTQDCSFSEADINEIETPPNIGRRSRSWTPAMPPPHRFSATMHRQQSMPRKPPAAHTSPRQPRLHRPALAPITNQRLQVLDTVANSSAKPVSVPRSPPAKPAHTMNLTDEDLSALQSEDWDDDFSLSKSLSPRAARSSIVQASQPGQGPIPPALGPSSSDIRSLALADWSDDL
ncbi:hypothetical protein F5X68DRAFT_215502 [Plectosphaerella plurivora]|uniref:Uncharacterized protein n=1 Tax=Plectosphaerella plurivora TaxID=936078 RepID=A0A9P8V458_9PEZI|nr:hypothetical protein F5X68DRAFT_215502 [Plectosphaerella plurivora]